MKNPIVITVDGENKYLFSHEDICELIADKLGLELGKYLMGKLKECDEKEAYAKARARTDCDSLEEENAYLSGSLTEIKEATEALRGYIEESKRISRKEIMEYVEDLEDKNVVG